LQPFGYEFELNRVQWTEDLQVSGRMRWDVSTGKVTADVRLRRAGAQSGTLTIEWNDVQKNAVATLSGAIGNKTVKAKRIAP
jgi:hypothetical protein